MTVATTTARRLYEGGGGGGGLRSGLLRTDLFGVDLKGDEMKMRILRQIVREAFDWRCILGGVFLAGVLRWIF